MATLRTKRPDSASHQLLDLFTGTGSVARVYQDRGFTLVTLDLDPATSPDILVDILQWDYQSQFKPGDLHTVFAAPPCTEYSVAKTTGPPGTTSWPTPS